MVRVVVSLIGFVFIFLPSLSLAALPVILEPQQPYEVLAVDADIEHAHTYLGELKGDPHLFEISLLEPKKFTVTISQRLENSAPVPFSLIVVRSNDNGRGVTEIGRVKGNEISWQENYDSALGFSLAVSEPVTYELTAGVYRFEVSSALNQGKYLLRVGNKSDNSSYNEKLQSIRIIQKFFAVSALHMMISSAVLYPLGCLVILVLIWLTWRYQRKKTANA